MRYHTEELSRLETDKTIEHIKIAEGRLRDECADYRRRLESEIDRNEGLKKELERIRSEFDQNKRVIREVEYEKSELHRHMAEVVEEGRALKERVK